MGKSVFAREDWSADLSSITCAEEDSDFPVENVLTTDPRGGSRMHTATGDPFTIAMQRSTPAPMNSLWVIGGNQGARASMQVVGKVGGSSGAVAFDTAPFGAGVWLGLDGASNSVIAGTASWASVQSFTLSCLITPDLLRRQGVLQIGSPAVAAGFVTMASDGTLRFWGENPSATLRGNLSSVTKAAIGTRLRIHATYNHTSGRMRLYVNGQQEAEITGVSTLVSLPTGIAIGQQDVSTFAGVIDDVRLWNVEQTPAQVAADTWTELAGTESGLLSYHQFENSYANTVGGAPTAVPLSTTPLFKYPERYWWSPGIGYEKYRNGAYLQPQGHTIDYLEFSIIDPENTAGYQAVGRVIVSAAWVTNRGRRFGGRRAIRAGSSRTLLQGATPIRRGMRRLTQRHSIAITSEGEAMLADRLSRLSDGRAVVVAHDWDDETYRHQKMVYGLLENPELTEKQDGADFWPFEFDVLEV
ncbi:MAG: LamG domain-containing protein [Myxococcota bacterium]